VPANVQRLLASQLGTRQDILQLLSTSTALQRALQPDFSLDTAILQAVEQLRRLSERTGHHYMDYSMFNNL
jgi:hypothetical protein